MDTRALDGRKHTFVLPEDHYIVALWAKTIRSRVLAMLEDFDFLESGVWRWGFTAQSAKKTILILVKNKKATS